MSGYFYALGGANYEKNESLVIDLDIIKETNKKKPNLLLIPRANFDNDKKISIFKQYYEKLGANVQVLYSFNKKVDKNHIKEVIFNADIIYLSGGITSELVSFVKEYNIDDMIIEAFNAGKIIVGVSAGAILFFEYGFGDKEAYSYNLETVNHKMTAGIGIFNGIFCPHYQNSGLITFHDEVRKYQKNAFALENGAALKIDNFSYTVVKSKGCNAFMFDASDDYKFHYLKNGESFENNLFKIKF